MLINGWSSSGIENFWILLFFATGLLYLFLIPNVSFNLTASLNKNQEHSSSVGGAGCRSDLDCSLNGLCLHDFCHCDKPWSGFTCEKLNFEPVSLPVGYGMVPNISSTWGGGLLVEDGSSSSSSDKTYHLFVTRMTNECRLRHWTKNSRVDHAISRSGPLGPFLFSDVAIPTQSHNPVPLALPGGGFAIFHIGDGGGDSNGGYNCSNTNKYDNVTNIPNIEQQKGSTIHISDSLYGPWKPLLNHTLGHCNNPAPVVHPNGTIYVGCRGRGGPGGTPVALLRSDSIMGPYINIAQLPGRSEDGATLEDPQLWIDFRGHFHCIYHAYQYSPNADNCENSLVSAHAFSIDGISWKLHSLPPYENKIELSNGQSMILATRERPKPFVEDGIITHLVDAVCGNPFCECSKGCVDCKYDNWDFTLISPLKVKRG